MFKQVQVLKENTFLINILCAQVKLNNHKARGFTWYPANGGICVLFDQSSRDETQGCLIDCVSFKSNDDLICHQMEGACAKGANFLYRST